MKPSSNRRRKNRAESPSPSVKELIEKLSPEDTELLISILSSRENVRMVSTLESKALLESLVKGEA